MTDPILVAMVSVYNSSKWLHQRIKNLQETTVFQNGQLLIYLANASSPDEQDHAICQSYAEQPGIRYERIPQCTVYSAWNWMINRTSTEFITNANSDDLIAPEGYEILMDGCRKHSADLAYCGWHTIGESITRWKEVTGPGEHVSGYNPAVDQMSCGHFPLWRRKIHDVVGLFDPSFVACGDADIWYRCWQNNIRNFSAIDAPFGGYRWRDGQNLWHRTDDGTRAREWQTISSRGPGKLIF